MAIDPLPLALVLIAALMHAGWNLMAKLGNDVLVAMALLKAPNILMALAVLLVVGIPTPDAWPYLAASVVANGFYFYFLINAYRAGDLSLAYPVARGLAPLLVLLFSFIAAGETPSSMAVAGVAVVSAGIVAAGVRRGATRQHWNTLLWAGGVALCIGFYTVTDGLGARLSGNPVGYVAFVNVVTGIGVCAVAMRRRGPAFAEALRTRFWHGVAGGSMMLSGYAIVVYALTLAPMGSIAALRESSVVFAAILGAIFLREPFGGRRTAAAVAVAVGIAMLVFGR